MNALDEDEAKRLHDSQLGRLLKTMEKPSFSGSFGYYMLARLLRVKKKHELWFLFAGRPIRFSLREFALVTELECEKFVQTRKIKNLVAQKPYWPELFGLLKSCTVDSVIHMRQKRKISDKEKRIKCVCLAVTASVLVPTSHVTKIVPEHVELIRDIDAFLSYPSGRVGFDLLVPSIKSKDELELSQKTIPVKGFFYAIQLVMMAAVPTLTEVVQAPSGESDSDYEDECDTAADVSTRQEANLSGDASDMAERATSSGVVKMMLSPSHAREIDEDEKTLIYSIIPTDEVCAIEGMDLRWADEVGDESVDVMVKLISEGYRFSTDMFTGGLTTADLVRMRTDKAQKEKEAKDKKKKDKTGDCSSFFATVDQEGIAELVLDKLKPELQSFSNSISEYVRQAPNSAELGDPPTRQCVPESDNQHQAPSIHSSGVKSGVYNVPNPKTSFNCGSHPPPNPLFQPTATVPTHMQKAPSLAMSNEDFIRSLTQSINAQMDLLLSVSPSFSLDLTQDEQFVAQKSDDINDNVSDNDEVLPRKSKRVKTSSVVYKDYQCGFNRTAAAKCAFSMPCDPNVNDSARFMELKAKLTHDKRPMEIYEGASVVTEDVIAIGDRIRVLHSKTAVKDRSKFKIHGSLLSYFESDNPRRPLPKAMYFSFNFDKRHWVGVCVNIPRAAIVVLDCNVSFHSDSALKRDFNPICNMFPFIVRAASTKALRDEKPFSLERVTSIPQNEINSDSAVTAVLLMQAHASARLDGCRTITPEVLTSEAYKLAVMFYDEFGPSP
ncbi:hypothetical protein EUTSA_v10002975mg [Eutrema salsugineum]|uniref:Ubiquitin-like protease family profile domain-containing protein n=1 Tax=Eutrema salsugineum TaxID=72664 RepID=V4L3Z0_EUTSA|nr:hypothetical protein EUTSA_v10002975mg [Eutrema salsugineum]